MREWFNKSLKWHLSALAASLALVVLLFYGLVFYFSKAGEFDNELQADLAAKYQTFIFNPYYEIYQDNYNEGYHALKATLESGGVALLGSSELTNRKSRFTTYNFMKPDLGVNLRAFGHAGYQNKVVLAELASVYNEKVAENGRVVILISPSWFASGEGTHEGLLNSEVTSPIVSSRIRENSHVEEEYKKAILGFREKFSLTFDLDRLLRIFYDNQFLNVDDKARRNVEVRVVTPDWESWKSEAKEFERKLSSNEYGINDEYYKLYVKPLMGTSKFPFKVDEGVPLTENKEIEDFKALLKFCEKFKHKPQFVILPLHRKAYSNLKVLDDEIVHIEQLIKEKNFPLLNFWSGPQQAGVLTDVMHTGAYGWVLINEFIYNNF